MDPSSTSIWAALASNQQSYVPLALGLAFIALISYFSLTLYNLYFHPLAEFPGPKAAVISSTWLQKLAETGYTEQNLEKLHQSYDTKALRIGPNELHLTDVHLYKVIYSQTAPFQKEKRFYDAFGIPNSLFTELDEGVHKVGRRLVSPYFSQASMVKLEPMILATLGDFRKRIAALETSKPVNIDNAFRCCTIDIISQFAFGKSLKALATTDDNFHQQFLGALDILNEKAWQRLAHPYFMKVAMMFPKWTTLGQLMAPLFKDAGEALQKYRARDIESEMPMIFDAISHYPDKVAVNEGILFLTAGSDTTAFTLTTAWCQILRKPEILLKLKAELKRAIPDKDDIPSLTKLNELEYLKACIKEALRHAMPVSGRLPRVVPASLHTPLAVDGKVIPAGTTVSISAYTMHNSEELWGPDAHEFVPERWLRDDGLAKDANMVTFSRGKRSCVGQNLALSELTIFTAHLFRLYDMELVSGAANVDNSRDFFTQMVQKPGACVSFRPVDD